MELLKIVQEYIYKNHLFTKNDDLLVAVSGGADSVALCTILTQLGYNFTIAHCNFNLRGAESDADEAFVVALADRLQKSILVKKMDTKVYMAEHNVNVQLAARQLRYSWFASLVNAATQQPFTHILTAHHQTDSVETTLLNFCKGTGINGLVGIPKRNGNIIRPLLSLSRVEILDYLAQQNINYVTDSSNAKNDYTRNFLRNEVLPLLQTKFTTIEHNIAQTIAHSSDAVLLYNEIVAQKIATITIVKGNELHIPIVKLQKEKAYKTLLYEIAKPYNFTAAQLPELVKLLTADNSSGISSATHQIFKNRNWLIITPLQTKEAVHILINEATNHIEFVEGTIAVKSTALFEPNNDINIAQLNAAELKFPLLLRPWATGDYFYPLGMRKKKKVARYLIDAKMSKVAKDKVWVLTSQQRIVWVIGQRIDDRCKCKENTKEVITFTYTPQQ